NLNTTPSSKEFIDSSSRRLRYRRAIWCDVSSWHYSDLSRCPLSGRYRRQSGHQPAIVGHRDFMRTCPRQPTGPNAALKTRPKPLPGRAPSPADPQPVARAAVFETLAEIPAKVIRVVRLQAPLETAETKPLPSGHRLDRLFAGWGRDGQKSQARE